MTYNLPWKRINLLGATVNYGCNFLVWEASLNLYAILIFFLRLQKTFRGKVETFPPRVKLLILDLPSSLVNSSDGSSCETLEEISYSRHLPQYSPFLCDTLTQIRNNSRVPFTFSTSYLTYYGQISIVNFWVTKNFKLGTI